MKIIVVGPSGSGKTVISNLISGHSDTPSPVYHPTAGTRILEFEKEPPRNMGGAMPAQVELWDCAGSSNYEKGWSAFKKDAVGVIYVFDPENK